MSTIPEALAQGLRDHQAGRLQQAEQTYRRILQGDPANAGALHLLGVIALQVGKHDQAIDLIGRAVRFDPANADCHSNLGLAYRAAGRLNEAVPHYQQALRLNSAHAEALSNLGAVFVDLGKPAEAMALCREALRVRPNYPEAHNNLGRALLDLGKPAEAAAAYQAALRLYPIYPEAHNNLGRALQDQGQLDQAAACFHIALRLRPGLAEAHNNLGSVLVEQGKPAEAMARFQEAIQLKPDYAEAHNNLGAVLMEEGRPEEAAGRCEEAVRRRPDYAMAYANLGELAAQGHYRLPDETVAHIMDLLAGGRLGLEDAGVLHYTLGRLLDKQGAYDAAFDHVRQANELRRQLLLQRNGHYQRDWHDALVGRLQTVFVPEFFQGVRSFGVNSELPVFIVGMPRSGTTLVEQVLASHPQVFGAGELMHLHRLANDLAQVLKTDAEYPLCMSRLDGPTARTLAEAHLRLLAGLGGGASRVVDKLPANFHHLGLIATLFPRARIIHCRRDALDVCVSCYFQNFKAVPYATSLEDLGFYYRQHERVMAHWHRVLPVPIHEVVYEDLVANFELVSREMVAFCGLEWDDRCLAFHESSRAVRTASKLQVRRPVYATSVGRWKRYEAHLRPLLEALNGSEAETQAAQVPSA